MNWDDPLLWVLIGLGVVTIGSLIAVLFSGKRRNGGGGIDLGFDGIGDGDSGGDGGGDGGD